MNRYRCSECGCYRIQGEGCLAQERLELKKSRALRRKQSLGVSPGDRKRTDENESSGG